MSDPMIILQGLTLQQFWTEMKAINRAIIREEIAAFNSKQEAEKLLSIKEVCDMLRISRPTLSSYCKSGKLDKLIVGGRIYFKKSEVETAIIQIKPFLKSTG
jgi:excisionase family DNA binding protein